LTTWLPSVLLSHNTHYTLTNYELYSTLHTTHYTDSQAELEDAQLHSILAYSAEQARHEASARIKREREIELEEEEQALQLAIARSEAESAAQAEAKGRARAGKQVGFMLCY